MPPIQVFHYSFSFLVNTYNGEPLDENSTDIQHRFRYLQAWTSLKIWRFAVVNLKRIQRACISLWRSVWSSEPRCNCTSFFSCFFSFVRLCLFEMYFSSSDPLVARSVFHKAVSFGFGAILEMAQQLHTHRKQVIGKVLDAPGLSRDSEVDVLQ